MSALSRVAKLSAAIDTERRRVAELGHAERMAAEAVAASRRELVQAIAEGKSERGPQRKLKEAQAQAAQPWQERREAAALKIREAEQALAAFIDSNLNEITGEMAPKAARARANVERALQAALESMVEWQAVDNEWSSLLRPVNGLITRPMPGLGLERTRSEILAALEAGIVEPMPRRDRLAEAIG